MRNIEVIEILGGIFMTKVIYKIADMNIAYDQCDLSYLSRFEKFLCRDKAIIDFKINMKKKWLIKKAKGDLILEEDLQWIKKTDGGMVTSMRDTKNKSKVGSLMEVNSEWSKAAIYYKNNKFDYFGYTAPELFSGIAFRNRIIHCNGIVVHASGVEWNGQGILLTAPSGTGKSTQAALWESHLGARILNDDCPALRVFENKVFMYGTPWSGSGIKYINEKSPLSMIVVLSQYKENIIEKVEKEEAVRMLIPRFFIPYHNPILMDKAIKVVEKIIKITPVYSLKCRPEVDAVMLVKKHLA